MGKVTFKWNMAGFAALRNHPALVAAMETAAHTAAAGTPFEVEVETFPHAGRRSGPRTAVQTWAASSEARRAVNEDPAELVRVLSRTHL